MKVGMLVKVIIFFVVLLLIAGFLFSGLNVSKKPSKTELNLALLHDALGLFLQKNGGYPESEKGLGLLIENPGGVSVLEEGDFLSDEWGQEIIYRHKSKCSDGGYDLYSKGENGVDECGGGDDLTGR